MRNFPAGMRALCSVCLVAAAAAAMRPAVVTIARPALPRAAAPLLQQGPMEDGFRELMPMAADEGNIDPEIVERMDAEVRALTGVALEDLLNPSTVVNLERERILTEAELGAAADGAERAELQEKLDKIETRLAAEKRTVFRGWLKNLFIGQSLLAIAISGLMVYDAIPGVQLDLSLRALGFWREGPSPAAGGAAPRTNPPLPPLPRRRRSYWLFVIPSLRARRPRGWEK